MVEVYATLRNNGVNLTGESFPGTILQLAANHPDNHGLHPTQKPVALYEYLIRTYTNEGDTVLDFCMGSGTTGVACVQTGRKFIGCDNVPEYVEIAKRRIAEAQAQLALPLGA